MKKEVSTSCKVLFEPSGLSVTVSRGTRILNAGQKAGIYLSSICGGDGYCGKCKVVVNSGSFESLSNTLLTPQEISENVVLACMTEVLSDINVTVPKEHSLEPDQILVEAERSQFTALVGTGRKHDYEFDPLVRKIYLELNPPTVDDHTADYERLTQAIRNRLGLDDVPLQMGYRVLQDIPKVRKYTNYKVTATIGFRDGVMEVIQLEPDDRSQFNYGVAIDLGTTTVVAQLIDMTNGKMLDSEASYNSQINYGEDYIRRIIYAEQNDAFGQLQISVVQDINCLIAALAERNKVDLRNITSVVCAGNTAMVHFLLNLDSRMIRREPYIATATSIPPLRAAEIGIKINSRGLLYCLPAVAAYVGGDIVSGVLATRLNSRSDMTLLVDIGTNGEIVLGNSEWMMCASSSAGPAFEGSGVKSGMRAASGAIESLQITPDGFISYKTIGHTAPVGLCGSGLLDTISELFANNIIDRTGRFVNKSGNDPRLVEGEDGWQYVLVPAKSGQVEIAITQADIDNLIRSKAGVYSAIKVLMDSVCITNDDLGMILLAGGFGNYLNVDRALSIGLLPDIPHEKIHFVANSAIAGAKAVLLSRQALSNSKQIADSMTYADLMGHSDYMGEFIQAKFLPHTDLSLFPSASGSSETA